MASKQSSALYRRHLSSETEINLLENVPQSSERPNLIIAYLTSHLRAALTSLGNLWRAPWATMMTLIVIAIAFVLPSALFVLLQNVKALSHNIAAESQISLYLNLNTTPTQVQTLLSKLRQQNNIADVKYISPDQGLAQLKNQLNISDALNALKTNPLPGVIVIQPAANFTSPAALQTMVKNLQLDPTVSLAQLDMQWVNRLYALIDLGKHLVYALSCLLALGVFFIIGNTINLSMQRHRREIEVFKLVGATDAFVRRPFLYTGILLGFGGSLIAWLLVSILLWSLQGPVTRLADLYGSKFILHNLNLHDGFILILGAIVLGLCGAWLAINKHLRAI